MLLDESAYIDAESPNGTTPLMMAARYGSPEAVQLLINEGADIHLKNQLGLTALNFAKDGGRPDTIKLVEAALNQAATATKR
jgi:ankyrin repeat protein